MTVTPSEICISVVGLGYVGLPTALAFHDAGFRVFGIDISTKVIEKINSGENPLSDESSEIVIPVDSDRWAVSNDFSEAIFESDIVLITVPTPVDASNNPDLSYVFSASKAVIESINKNSRTIITLESTVFPGVTRSVLGKICEDSGIIIGEQVFLAYSPERVSPGDPERTIASVARIVGCDSPDIGNFLAEVYSHTTDSSSTFVGSIEVAEASKLIENAQRDVDIAFVNELSTILPLMGLDVEEVLNAASTKWNFHRHSPGIGVGGHCIPVDPYYYISLSEDLGVKTKLGVAAREINESMPVKSAEQVMKIISKQDIRGKNALVLGYSYKPETGDTRETPVRELTRILADNGFEILIWDPYVPQEELPPWVTFIEDFNVIQGIDMVLIATAHKAILSIDWEELRNKCNNPFIFDGRRVLDPVEMENCGWAYYGVGHPSSF